MTGPDPAPRTLLRRARPLLHLVTLFSLAYVGYVAARNLGALSVSHVPDQAIATAAALAAAYGATLLLLAENWHRLVAISGTGQPARARTCRIFTDTQLAKYLPGNVLHIVTRHLRLKDDTLTHGVLARAFLFETAALVLGAAMLAAAVLSIAPPTNGTPAVIWAEFATPAQFGVVGITLLAIALGLATVRRPSAVALRTFLISLAMTAAFFAVSGGSFYLICASIAAQPDPALIGFAAIAWIAGFVVPGAPGGLGPREAVLLALAAPSLGEPAALLAIALYRCTTLLGDVICFVLGRILYRQRVSDSA